MAQRKTKRTLQEIKELIAEEENILRLLIGAVLQEVLEAEMSQALGAEKRRTGLDEMYIEGVSTRKVKAITEELCGHEFSASAISAIHKGLDEELQSFMARPGGRINGR